jgi:hypothetical protein
MTELREYLFIVGRLTNRWIEPSVIDERLLLLTLSDPLN